MKLGVLSRLYNGGVVQDLKLWWECGSDLFFKST